MKISQCILPFEELQEKLAVLKIAAQLKFEQKVQLIS